MKSTYTHRYKLSNMCVCLYLYFVCISKHTFQVNVCSCVFLSVSCVYFLYALAFALSRIAQLRVVCRYKTVFRLIKFQIKCTQQMQQTLTASLSLSLVFWLSLTRTLTPFACLSLCVCDKYNNNMHNVHEKCQQQFSESKRLFAVFYALILLLLLLSLSLALGSYALCCVQLTTTTSSCFVSTRSIP